jgi:hypothetical protein
MNGWWEKVKIEGVQGKIFRGENTPRIGFARVKPTFKAVTCQTFHANSLRPFS